MTLLTQAEWAGKHRFSKQYANELVKNGVISLINGKIDSEEADIILSSRTDPTKQKRHKGNSDIANLSTLLLKAKLKSEKERSKILKEKAKSVNGEYISKEAIKEIAFNKARIVRDSLLNIPDRIASLLASIDNSHRIHEILTTEICSSLEELSQDV